VSTCLCILLCFLLSGHRGELERFSCCDAPPPGAICNRQVDSYHTYLAASGLDTDSCGAGWEALVNDGTGVQAKGAAA
jgi:hypothetical protein